MNVENQLKFSLLGRIGSFWGEQTSPKTADIARSVVYRSADPVWLQDMDAIATSLAGTSDKVLRRDRVVSFDASEVIYAGPDIFRKWQADLQTDSSRLTIVRYDEARMRASSIVSSGVRYILDDTGRFIIYENLDLPELSFTDTTYYVPLEFESQPITILDELSKRTLMAGIDFVIGDGYLIFKESPTKLFPNGRMVWSTYICQAENYRDYALKQDHDNSKGFWIQEYYRHSQSAYNFEKALAEYSGLVVLMEEGLVLSAQPIFGGFRYIVAERGLVNVPYAHRPLKVGDTYPKGHIIDNQFKVYHKKDTDSSDWWLHALGDGRASLDGILPGDGCWVSNNSILVDYADIHSNGKVHARLHYEGSGSTKEKAWETMRNQETSKGVFLSDSLGLSLTNPAKQVNLMKLIADFYGDRLLIVRLGGYTGNTERVKRIKDFIDREKPIGALTLTIDI